MIEKDYCKHFDEEERGYLCCVDEVGETVKRMVRNFQRLERDHIKSLGFTTTQCYCLLELHKNGALTMQELSDKMKLNSSTMTRIVDKLVRDKFIKRFRGEHDRRIVMVELTEEGSKAADEADCTINAYYEEITKLLPKDDIEDVLNSVSLLMDAFESANPNCC